MFGSNFSRREFIKSISACAAGSVITKGFMPFSEGVAFAQSSCSASRKVLIHIFLNGGPHGPSILVPRATQSYFDKHPNIGIANPLPLDAAHGLNPNMPNLYNLYNQGFLAIGNGSGYPGHSRSHEDATNTIGRGIVANTGEVSGWSGRFAKNYCSTSEIFSLFSFRGNVSEVSAPGVTALTGSNLSQYGYQNDGQGTNNNIFIRQTIKDSRVASQLQNPHHQSMLASWEVADSAVQTISQVNQINPPTYNGGGLGQRLRDARKLITSPSISVRHIHISQGGYDTHDNQVTNLTRLLSELDAAIGSFWADISDPAVNRAPDVDIVIEGEFGRTHENGNGGATNLALRGTDHGTGGILMVIGRNVRGGVFSPAYSDADFVQRNPWIPVKFDYREVLAQVLEKHQGVDPSIIFPEAFNKIGLNVMI